MRENTPLTRIKLLMLALFLATATIVATGFITAILNLTLNHGESSRTDFIQPSFLFIYTLCSLVASLLTIAIWKRLLRHNRSRLANTVPDPVFQDQKRAINFSAWSGFIILVVVFSYATDLINSRIFLLPKITEWQKAMITSAQGSSADTLLLFISVVILAPIWEELIFRGVLYSGLRLLIPQNIAILLSSLCWTLAHAKQYNTIILSEIVIIGIILSLARIHSKSLRLPIILHITNNLIAFINLYSYSNIG